MKLIPFLRASKTIYVVDFNKYELVGGPHATVEDALRFAMKNVKQDDKTHVGLLQLVGVAKPR